MNSSTSTTTNGEIRQLERSISTLLNRQLQHICASHGLRGTGVKAELQIRIRNALIESYAHDPATFRQIQTTIQSIVGGSSRPQSSMPNPPGPRHAYSYAAGTSNTEVPGASRYGQLPGATGLASPLANFGPSGVPSASTLDYYKNNLQSMRGAQFKPSPFYNPIARIGDILTCDVMAQHRNTIHISIKINEHPSLSNLSEDKSLRLMIFCASENTGVQEIAFPHQSEIKVNGGDVKANLRGLKGKPGTTRPVDITDLLRLKPATYNNNVEFTYALTSKVKMHDPSPEATKYYLTTFLCQMVPVDTLVTKIKRKKITKNTVIQEITRKAKDPDVVATSTVLSLRCPLTYTRLRTPSRSTTCSHVQCFDASAYLQLQEQGPQWICPICNKSAPFDTLAIDDYVADILEKTTDSIEQVTIEPSGQWMVPSNKTATKSRSSDTDANLDGDDELSVIDDRRSNISGTPRTFATPIPTSAGNGATSSAGSKEPSSGPPRSNGKKRPAEVIDLTLSSDEEDSEPISRPAKRHNAGSGV